MLQAEHLPNGISRSNFLALDRISQSLEYGKKPCKLEELVLLVKRIPI